MLKYLSSAILYFLSIPMDHPIPNLKKKYRMTLPKKLKQTKFGHNNVYNVPGILYCLLKVSSSKKC